MVRSFIESRVTSGAGLKGDLRSSPLVRIGYTSIVSGTGRTIQPIAGGTYVAFGEWPTRELVSGGQCATLHRDGIGLLI